ncbi:hypothetical protein QBC47DRAFT_454050 [Echria macrotheca]|uniref:Uncharacterized protein n=1 Tax=Echria macrotheca TaxID=438768 RepID=A0AAJ0B6L8_9PEZI|nr:hypothetical protein QBC47DRAFT_454050 [Echria macrotheca]
MTSWVLVVALASSQLPGEAAAFTRFDPVCTPPQTSVNFVSAPQIRGTLEILWSCIFTLLACTWTIQHLNLPQQRNYRRRETAWWASLKWDLAVFWTNLKWMLFTMVAPEIVLGKAVGDYFEARSLNKLFTEMKAQGKIEQDAPWSLTHSFFAMMGGIRVIQEEESRALNDESEPHESQIERSYVLLPRFLFRLRSSGDIPAMPSITEPEIMDRSKSSVFVKALAVLQVCWVCMQVIGRSARGLAVSQLELVVVAFAVCAVFIYAFLASKPKDVRIALPPIRLSPVLLADVASWHGYPRPLFALVIFPSFVREKIAASAHSDYPPRRVPNDGMQGSGAPYVLGFITGGVIFGAIHVAGWNLVFPTPVEQLLWRVCSLLIMVLVPMWLSLAPCVAAVLDSSWGVTFEERVDSVFGILFTLVSLIYLAARIILLVLTFRSLAYLPPDAYIATWASEVPYVG